MPSLSSSGPSGGHNWRREKEGRGRRVVKRREEHEQKRVVVVVAETTLHHDMLEPNKLLVVQAWRASNHSSSHAPHLEIRKYKPFTVYDSRTS